MTCKPSVLALLACMLPCFSQGLSSLNTLSLGNTKLSQAGLRVGSDLHTGKFVIEHRISQRNESTFPLRNESSLCSVDDRYEIYGVLGEGGFATVRKAVHRTTNHSFAIKTIDLCNVGPEQRHLLREEVEIMKMLDHPNVIKLYETFEEEDKLHLILERCDGGDLFDFIMKTSGESGQKTWTDGSVRIISMAPHFYWAESGDVCRDYLLEPLLAPSRIFLPLPLQEERITAAALVTSVPSEKPMTHFVI